MYLHFIPLRRGQRDSAYGFGCRSNLLVGTRDWYDDQFDVHAHPTSDICVRVGEIFSPQDYGCETILPLYKSWELRSIPSQKRLVGVERLFYRDGNDFIPFRVRVRYSTTHNDTYVLYKNLEEIHRRNTNIADLTCIDPRLDAVDQIFRHDYCKLDWCSSLDFSDYLHEHPLIANVVGRRDLDEYTSGKNVVRVIEGLRRCPIDLGIDRFRSLRNTLLPSLMELPRAYLSEDVTTTTLKEIERGYHDSRFGDEPVEPLEWTEIENVIPMPAIFTKTMAYLEDLTLTDVNIDLHISRSDIIDNFTVAAALDRYCELDRYRRGDVEADMFASIVEEFVSAFYIHADRVRLWCDFIRHRYTMKIIKTALDEALILIYPDNAKASDAPFFGVYFDIAAHGLGDNNTLFL